MPRITFRKNKPNGFNSFRGFTGRIDGKWFAQGFECTNGDWTGSITVKDVTKHCGWRWVALRRAYPTEAELRAAIKRAAIEHADRLHPLED